MSRLGNKVSRLSAGTRARQEHRLETTAEPALLSEAEIEAKGPTMQATEVMGKSEKVRRAKKTKKSAKKRKKA